MLGLLVGLSGDRSRPLGVGARVGVFVAGLLGIGMALWKIADVYSMKERSGGGEFDAALSSAIRVGVGLWVMAAAGAMLLGPAITARRY